MTYTIEAKELTKSFRGRPVLTGLDLRVKAGTVFALLGPNGAGKTTRVRILSTLLAADGGAARGARPHRRGGAGPGRATPGGSASSRRCGHPTAGPRASPATTARPSLGAYAARSA